MRKELEDLDARVSRIEPDNLYQALADLKRLISEMLEYVDRALPKDVSDDV